MTAPSNDLRQEWATARQLYPLYAALAREFVIELPSCGDLEAGVDAPPRESVELARQWLVDMDERIQVHQLRQFLQTTTLVDDGALRLLLSHYLTKAKHTEPDRDKLDFLLVQFFSHVTPSRLEDADVDLDYVAQTLEPVLGSVSPVVPESLSVVDTFVQTASRSRTLNELLSSGILDKGRKLKVSEGANYFEPSAMIVFTRFNFLMRRVFFRLMHQDLNAILDGLRDLERNGVNSLDCRRAQFSADEPTVRLRMICQSWKVMFHAEYSSGQPLRMLVDLRSVVDAALLRSSKSPAKKAMTPESPRARATAAGAGADASASDVPEFEVLSDASDAGDDEKA
jgi:hypothetical protein